MGRAAACRRYGCSPTRAACPIPAPRWRVCRAASPAWCCAMTANRVARHSVWTWRGSAARDASSWWCPETSGWRRRWGRACICAADIGPASWLTRRRDGDALSPVRPMGRRTCNGPGLPEQHWSSCRQHSALPATQARPRLGRFAGRLWPDLRDYRWRPSVVWMPRAFGGCPAPCARRSGRSGLSSEPTVAVQPQCFGNAMSSIERPLPD
jgi:hypothetical protein